MKKVTSIRHLAVIPDGNRRWAKRNMIIDEESIYQKGTKRIREIMEAAFEKDIVFFTLWASSLANLNNRSGSFRDAMNISYARKFNDLATNRFVREKGIKIQVVGEWEGKLNEAATEAIRNAVWSTAENSEKVLTVLVGYDGKRERGAAVLRLLEGVKAKRLALLQSPDEANLILKSQAWTGHLPDVDLIIRTGSWEDPHLSADFLTFLTGESQLAFPRVFWPDFSKEEFQKVLSAYGKRERRFGK